MQLIESEKIELKSKLTNDISRDIVSFLNSDGGQIYIGINDDGSICGVDKIDEALRFISEVIYSQIEPSAIDDVSSKIIQEDTVPIIVITISKGRHPLYCIKKYGYSSKGCLIRTGSSCHEMSESQINERYILRFFNEDILVSCQTNLDILSFHTLKNYYSDKGYKLNEETYQKDLQLTNSQRKYNVMAELLSDDNRYSLIFVKFNGTNKSSISQRSDYGKKSLLFAYDQLKNRIAAENICLSNTKVRPRIDTYLYDFDSVNEAIVNAIVHNDWSITEPQISFYSDRIEILSHGGLPPSLSIEEFYQGISKPRNIQLMRIFSDLDIVDHTGHGIPIIIERYGKDAFDITNNHIKVTIPFNIDIINNYKKVLNNGLLNDTLKPKIDTLKQKNDTLKPEIDTLKQKNDTLKQKNDTLKQKNDTLKPEIDTLKQKNDTLKPEIDTLKQKNDTLKLEKPVEKEILNIVLSKEKITSNDISRELSKSRSTINRHIKSLQSKGYITRKGTKKNGYWTINES